MAIFQKLKIGRKKTKTLRFNKNQYSDNVEQEAKNSSYSRISRRSVKDKKYPLRNSKKKYFLKYLFLIMIIFLIYQFGFIHSIQINSNDKALVTEISNLIKPNIARKLYFKPFINSNNLNKTIVDNIKSIKSVKTVLNFANSNLIINPKVREPAVWWRGTGDDNMQIWAVDNEGYLFDISTNSKYLDIPTIQDQLNRQIEFGQKATSSNIIRFVTILNKSLKDQKIISDNVTYILPGGLRELQLRDNQKPYIVKFNVNKGINDQISELAELLNYLKNQNIIPKQYIDLRVDDTAYYK